jgi:SAM-dependent methyltransferase
MTRQHTGMSVYDAIARIYDPWSRTVVEDVPFYVEEARRAGGPVVELCVGTGRIAVPIAVEGIPVIGVDSSPRMLEVAAETAALAGVELDLRLGDLRDPPLEGEYPLVIIPFRSLLHMRTDEDRRSALRAVHRLLAPNGRFVFDVFTPSPEDIAETQDRWLEREPGIHERAEWDEARQTLVLRVRGQGVDAALDLTWLTVAEWGVLLLEEGFVVDAVYGWFDRVRWHGHEDSIWVCRRS